MNSNSGNKSPSLVAVVILLLLFSGWGKVSGQRFQTRAYTEIDGLSSSMTYAILQDSSGVIWIGRRSGISSYDGASFTNFNITNGLRTSTYAFLDFDESQTLYGLPEGGDLFVVKRNGDLWESLNPDGKIPKVFTAGYTSFDAHVKDGVEEFLIGTYDKGMIHCRDKKWSIIDARVGLPEGRVNSVRRLGDTIYIATPKGLWFLYNGRVSQITGVPFLRKNIVAMEPDGRRMWLVGETVLGYLESGKYTPVTTGFKIHYVGSGKQCFLHIGINNKLYFGNSFAVFYYDRSDNTTGLLDRHNGLITNGGTSALVDREMNVWITGYRGLTKITSERFVSFYEMDGLQSNEVASVLETSPGHYVFGHDGALTFYDGKTMTHLLLNGTGTKTNYESRVLDLQKDPHGNVWLAVSSLGVARLDKEKKITWFRNPEELGRQTYSVAFSSHGELFAGNIFGLYKLGKEGFARINFADGKIYSIRKIFPEPDGSLYLASMSVGLLHYTAQGLQVFSCSNSRLANNVFGFLSDTGNQKWVGTAAGLYEVKGDELVRVNRGGLKITRPVYLILKDARGNLWFGTDNGIYRWDGSNLDHFTVKDGLSGHDISRSAGLIDSRGHIWFGSNNGITMYRPELDRATNKVVPPKVTLLHAVSGHDTLTINEDLTLPNSSHNLEFRIKVISLINEDHNYIRYYLEGHDSGWSEEKPYQCANILYNNLKPGSYRLHLMARNAVGTWSEPIVTGSYTIRQPIFLRWWFIVLFLLVLGAIIYILVRFVIISRYKNELEGQVKLRTLELTTSEQLLKESNRAKDSFFSIIAHDLRNPFNVILGYLDLLTDDDADYSLDEQKNILLKLKSASVRTIDLLENLLTWARSQRGSLPFEPELFRVSDVIDESVALMENAAQSKQISLVFSGDRDLMVFADRNMINTVIRNLISNALKFTHPEGSVLVRARQESAQMVVISIKDNGVGISTELVERLFKIEQRTIMRGTANETGTGLGLILCKEFVEKNNGQIWVVSDPNKGTVFSVSLPATKSTASINPDKIIV